MSKTPEQPDFKAVQYAFTAHIRNPRDNPRPDDVEARRMKVYADLLYNNVEGFISSGFPVLRKITDDEKWHAMVRDYFHHHRATTPLFYEMSREFLKYLENERAPSNDDFPFMLELAHYEWVELALSVSDQQIDWNGIDPAGDLLEGRPAMSALAWPLTYSFPVHRIGPDFLPQTPPEQPTCLVVYRDRDDEVHFLEINPVTAQLLQSIQQPDNLSGRQMLLHIAEQLGHPDPDTVVQGGLHILEDLRKRDVVLGTENP
jgi:hypothetical protein